MKQILTTLFIVSALLVSAQDNAKPLNKHDKNKYFKLIYDDCPGADILNIEYREDYIEIDYLCGEHFYEIGISNNKIIFKESKIDEGEIPFDKIQHKLSKKYGGWLLDEISLISTADTSFLKVEIIKDGIEQNLYVTLDGKWYKSKSIYASDKWTIGSLSKSALYEQAGYNLLSPNNIYYLPEILREISGLALSGSNTVFCVQDELGAVFEYDLAGEEIKSIHRFTDLGDFEDITIKGDSLFVLRSDGTIFYFNSKNKTAINQRMISLHALNFESLTYNKHDNHFYVVSKDAMLNHEETERTVYNFPLHEFHRPKFFLRVDINDINNLLKQSSGSMVNEDMLFNPSAIAIHPKTNDIYILSANDRILVVYEKSGLKKAFPLPAVIYYKPEGLAFYENGDLLISSEGDKRGLVKGSIVLLKYQE